MVCGSHMARIPLLTNACTSLSCHSPSARSRLIVKNLPNYLSDARLKEHFGQRGLVTDVKLMTRPDGTSRRFGFVGYRTEEEARDALAYFNRTFIDTSRIQVDLAKRIGDEGLANEREVRKQRRDQGREEGHRVIDVAGEQSAAAAGKKSKKGKAAEKSKASKGVSFEEFMAVMAPKKKRKTWQNEEDDPEEKLKDSSSAAAAVEEAGELRKAKKAKQAATDVNAVISAPSAPVAPQVEEREVTPDAALNDEELTDMDYLAKRMKRNVAAEEPVKTFEQSDSEDDKDGKDEDEDSEAESEVEDEVAKARVEKQRVSAEEKAKKDQEAVDTIMASGRLFIRNLPFAATEEDVTKHFSSFGPLKQVSTVSLRTFFPPLDERTYDDRMYRDS